MPDLFGYATCRGRRVGRYWKDAPKPPPTPDYGAAARQSGLNDLQSARLATKANRVNQVTPYGSLTWTHTGSDPDAGWTQTVSLSPNQKALLAAQDKTSLGLAALQNQGLGYVRDVLSKNITMDDLPKSMINPGETAQEAIMRRMRPDLEQRRAAEEQKLANQGIRLGSEAYGNAMKLLERAENDAYSQAALAGIDTGMRAQTQQLGLLGALQDRPINILNAIRTGAQVTNPAFEAYAQQATTGGADMLAAAAAQGQAAQGLYNSQMGAYNANGGWLGPIGSAGANLGSAYLMGNRPLPFGIG